MILSQRRCVTIKYLEEISSCGFFHHKADIRINRILSTIRQTDTVKDTDRIIIQALLEIIDDIREYGPFSITLRKRTEDEMITVCHDCHVVLFLTRSPEAKIRISYLRDDDLSWAEELCALAEAHAQILQAEC